MTTPTRDTRLRLFFRLAFLLCWGPGALYLIAPQQMSALFGPMTFASPVLYLAVFAPSISALLCARLESRVAFDDLLARFTRWRVKPLLYVGAVVGVAALALLPRYAVALLGQAPVPTVTDLVAPAGLAGLAYATLADPGPLGEELGWRGYALPRLQRRFSGLGAALILGAVWALWHVPAFFLAGLPQARIPFLPWAICTLALSVLLAWITNRARGAVAPAILAHWSWNHAADLTGAAAWPTAFALTIAALALVGFSGGELDRSANPGVPG